jgi:3-hydroxymyristoyl/3-hydroxydecanoyl-(acyl carrier protein) dehydratase
MDRNEYYLNVDEIKKFLPHRNPMLMVDKVLEIHPTGDIDDLLACDKVGTRVVAIKCVTQNESFFQGHYPKFSIMPGCLMLETMAQTAAFSLYPAISELQQEALNLSTQWLQGMIMLASESLLSLAMYYE